MQQISLRDLLEQLTAVLATHSDSGNLMSVTAMAVSSQKASILGDNVSGGSVIHLWLPIPNCAPRSTGELLRGWYTPEEQAPDPDLGKSLREGWRNTEVPGKVGTGAPAPAAYCCRSLSAAWEDALCPQGSRTSSTARS